MLNILDLHFKQLPKTIGSYLIPSTDGLILIESGPYSTYQNLKKEIEKCGFDIADVNHVLLTHIHFDHAGAAWAFAKDGATIYLHPFGEKHMADPSKLVASATMIYGDQMDTLWGKMESIPQEKLRVVEDGEVLQIGEHSIKSIHTPGHAKHHIAWKWNDVIFTGDIAGVKIEEGLVVPPCPPPDINLEDWEESIQKILAENPNKLVLTHFGAVDSPTEHLAELKIVLHDWADWVKEKWESGLSNDEITPLFTGYTTNQLKSKGLSDEMVSQYEAANPSWMSVAGLVRYWKKKM